MDLSCQKHRMITWIELTNKQIEEILFGPTTDSAFEFGELSTSAEPHLAFHSLHVRVFLFFFIEN